MARGSTLQEKILSEGNWKIADKERQSELLDFTRQITAEKLRSKESLAIIIKTASKVASQLEDTGKEASTAAWKQHVRGKVGGCGKGAYAFAKGPIGFLEAPETDHDDTSRVSGHDIDNDDGDLDAAIFMAARSMHE